MSLVKTLRTALGIISGAAQFQVELSFYTIVWCFGSCMDLKYTAPHEAKFRMSVGHFQMPDFPRMGKGSLPMKISKRMCCGVQKPPRAFRPRLIHMHSVPRATCV